MSRRRSYYNDNDPDIADWLRELVREGLLPDGDVDDRSICDVEAVDIFEYDQVHFFAGIGGWPLALERAGWGDRPIWTGSAPCQAWSNAGQRKGADDERHLWPYMYDLIQHCQPEILIGEQVASSDVIGRVSGIVQEQDAAAWLDLVFDDLEAAHYACGSVVTPTCSVGSPHVRHRLYWLAHANNARSQGRSQRRNRAGQRTVGSNGVAGRMADADGTDDANSTSGFWKDCDWLLCRDERWRAVEPGTFPLVNGLPRNVVQSGDPGLALETSEARLNRIRGYGNAVNVAVATTFVECITDVLDLDTNQ